jgi:hypothetical protein
LPRAYARILHAGEGTLLSPAYKNYSRRAWRRGRRRAVLSIVKQPFYRAPITAYAASSPTLMTPSAMEPRRNVNP